MGLLQKAVETYESHESLAGVYQEGSVPLAPIAHTVKKADIEIILTKEGKFYDAVLLNEKDQYTVIPVSPASAGRSGKKIVPHPLCEQLCYLAPCYQDKYSAYVEQLDKWSNSEFSHKKVDAVLSYIRSGTILGDLKRKIALQIADDGTPKKEKLMVRWRILDCENEEACYKDTSLFSAFQMFTDASFERKPKQLCMVMGCYSPMPDMHPKGVVSVHGNAKIISSNDKKGFTYRGRLVDEEQVLSVGYEASQKAHNALKWLVDNQSVSVNLGGRTFLCWNPLGKSVPHAALPFCASRNSACSPSEYQDQLRDTLSGWKTRLPNKSGVVITSLDAATDGRLAVTYYNEFRGSDFLDRLYEWDKHCCWPTGRLGEIMSPKLEEIVHCAYGRLKTGKQGLIWDTDKKLMRQWIQVLIACRIDKTMVPSELVSLLVDRASCPERFESQDKNGYKRDQLLSTSCAVIKKYRYDKFKEEWEMALEPEKMDRSYQFGRLLAVFEKIERATLRKADREHRITYAIRNQNAFCNRPFTTAVEINKHLEDAYLPRLSNGSQNFYKNLIGGIMEMLSRMPQDDLNKKLSETYLLGYYLQRNTLNQYTTGMDEEEV